MEQNNSPMVCEEPQYKPNVARKTYRHYKPAAILYKRIVIGMGLLLAVLVFCLVQAIRGNATLKGQLAQSKIIGAQSK